MFYEHYVGPIPPGMFACHTCDNPKCVNPAHIFLGTLADNNHDMIAKGRARQAGAHNGRAVLTEADIPTIRARLAAGDRMSQIARDYRVDHSTIRHINIGKAWRHVQ